MSYATDDFSESLSRVGIEPTDIDKVIAAWGHGDGGGGTRHMTSFRCPNCATMLLAPGADHHCGRCQKCGDRPATVNWSNGGMDFARGYYQRWCEECCLTEQIKSARAAVARLPGLEARLSEIRKRDTT